MNKKVFLIDGNNKQMKWLSTAWRRIAIIPIIDVIVLLLGVSTILFFLNEYKVANLYFDGKDFVTYIYIVLAYIGISMVIAIFDFIKFYSLNNTIIMKENSIITIIKGPKNIAGVSKTTIGSISFNSSNSLLESLASFGLYTSGTIEMQKSLSENDTKTIVQINKILEEKNSDYKFITYKNCKLVNETKKHYKYVGEKDGVFSKFKIYKVYSNINLLNKEEK